MLAELRSSHFLPLLHQTFQISSDPAESPAGVPTGASLPAELIQVDVLGTDPPASVRRAPFSLIFRASEPKVLPQRIYRIEHPALGRLEIFLVPLGADPPGSGMRYEAVFG
jgi:hypothetical protein